MANEEKTWPFWDHATARAHSHYSIARSAVQLSSRPSRSSVTARAYKVNLKDIDGKVTTLEVGIHASALRGGML